MDLGLLLTQSEHHVLLAQQDAVAARITEANVNRFLHRAMVVTAVDSAKSLKLEARREHADDAQVARTLSFTDSEAVAVDLIAVGRHLEDI